jgi:hypothetical protein
MSASPTGVLVGPRTTIDGLEYAAIGPSIVTLCQLKFARAQ